MTLLRRPEKWVSNDTLSTFTFPLYSLAWQSTQQLNQGFAPVVGGDYPVDYSGANLSAKRMGTERISFWLISQLATPTGLDVDAKVDAMVKTLMNGALGKLYTVDDAANERWSYARVAKLPEFIVDFDARYRAKDVRTEFDRLSDWFDVAATTGTVAVTATPTNFTITNPGNAIVRTAVFTWTPNGATPLATNPKLFNLTTGFVQNFQYNTVSALNAAAMRLKVDCENYTVKRSTDSGATYPTNDYANFVLPATQTAFMELAPGANTMQLTDGGTPSYSLAYSFFPAYHR